MLIKTKSHATFVKITAIIKIVSIDLIIKQKYTAARHTSIDCSGTIISELKSERRDKAKKTFAIELKTKVLNGTTFEVLKNNNEKLEYIPSDEKKLSDSFISLGKSDQLIGSLIRSDKDDLLGPVKTFRGYGLVMVNKISEFDSTAWINQQNIIKSDLTRTKQNKFYQNWMSELKEKAKIIDNRKYYF